VSGGNRKNRHGWRVREGLSWRCLGSGRWNASLQRRGGTGFGPFLESRDWQLSVAPRDGRVHVKGVGRPVLVGIDQCGSELGKSSAR
jgi:hypothetical protein